MIEAIFVAPKAKQPQISVDIVQCVMGKGITGDRNYGKSKWPGQNITFIEAEEIDRYNTEYSQNVFPGDMRRNIITRHIRLNELVGKKFALGDVIFKGIELCEPCNQLGELLKKDNLPKATVIKSLLHRTGLRADIISSGNISVGMAFTFDDK